MDKFLVFGGEAYYASGGYNDYIDSFETIDEAREKCIELKSKYYTFDWWHIVKGGVIVSESDMVPHKHDDGFRNWNK